MSQTEKVALPEFQNINEYNAFVQQKTLVNRDVFLEKRAERWYTASEDYFLQKLGSQIFQSLSSAVKELYNTSIDATDLEIRYIDRTKFKGDVTIGIPSLIKQIGFQNYVSVLIPRVLEALLGGADSIFVSGYTTGIYLNLTLKNSSLGKVVEDALVLGTRFGENNLHKNENVVIDFSSPNVAKHLHAGHIRSTIIGQILSNIYDANGYAVHGINYINDWGGMGYIIEGYRRWGKLADTIAKNDFLAKVYGIYRSWQKFSASEEAFNGKTEAESQELAKFIGEYASYEAYQQGFKEYDTASRAAFALLESGDSDIFTIWVKLVEWSLEDFKKFYELLRVHHPYIIGESFYALDGKSLIEELYSEGKVVFFDEEKAQIEKELLVQTREARKMKDAEFERTLAEIDADIGSYLVILPDFKRYVVLKWDKSTIYATRDMAAVKHRIETFSPSMMVYEVGQEQSDHFSKLFESSKVVGFIPEGKNISFHHIYHGFYVSEATKKKLSSREGASNIYALIEGSIDYFRKKYDQSTEYSHEEIELMARVLGVGSIIYNDIRRDKKSPIPISSEIESACRQFEESGGAYIIYTTCRAKSILRKSRVDMPALAKSFLDSLGDEEIELTKKIGDFPGAVRLACDNHDPTVLATYLFELSQSYNTYYNCVHVLNEPDENKKNMRLLVTQAVAITIDKGLSLCHIETLDRM